MIELLIFHIHIIGALYAFTKSWQTKSLKDGFLSLVLLALLFTIGWALTGTIAYALMPGESTNLYFNRDVLSLSLLLIPETVFFYFFFYKEK